MSPFAVGTIVLVCTFGAAMGGLRLRARLPSTHLDAASQTTVTLGIGLVATLTALILGLVTASVKSSFDEVDATVKHAAVEILTLDRVLARYGAETAAIRNDVKHALALRIDMTWPQESSRAARPDPWELMRKVEGVVGGIQGLSPQNDAQQRLRSRAMDLGEALLEGRWGAVSTGRTSIPGFFLVVLVFWLTVTFASFGLFAPRNGTVIAVLFVCALSVAAAVFLLLEMDSPFAGLIKVSPEPLRFALSQVNR